MAQIRICDRCKNEIDNSHKLLGITLEKIRYKALTSTPANFKKSFDLCPECYNAVLGIIEHGDACIHFVDERKEI